MQKLGSIIVLLTALGAAGCVSPWINEPTSPSSFTPIDERFVLASVVPGAGARGEEAAPIVAGIDRALATVFQQSGLLPRLIREQDAPSVLPEGRVFLVRFDVTNVVVTQDIQYGPKMTALIFCSIGVLPACLGLAARGAQHPIAEAVTVTAEMRVFEVSGAEVRMFEGEEGSPRRIDISGNRPLSVATYEARVDARRGGKRDLGEARALFNGEMVLDLTRQLAADAARDLPGVVAGSTGPGNDW